MEYDQSLWSMVQLPSSSNSANNSCAVSHGCRVCPRSCAALTLSGCRAFAAPAMYSVRLHCQVCQQGAHPVRVEVRDELTVQIMLQIVAEFNANSKEVVDQCEQALSEAKPGAPYFFAASR